MNGSTLTPRTTRAPWGLIGMLGLVVAIEAGLERHHLDFTRFYIHDWRVSGRAARAVAPACDVLCFGDSLVKFGVAPRAIEPRLGRRVYNLAVCDGQAPSSFFLLRRALEAGARPTAVVVDFAPHLLSAGPRHNLRHWPELVTTREGLELGLTAKHAAMGAELVLGCLLRSVKDRDEIRDAVLAALRGESTSRRGEILDHVRQWREDQGAQLCAPRPSYRGAIDPANPAYFPRAWKCRSTNETYLRRFLALASAHRVRVFWLLPPVTPRFQARRDALGLEASHTRFVRRLQAEFAKLTVIDARHAGYDHSRFIDPLHLDRRGAAALSTELAGILAREFEGRGPTPRWVELPAGRPEDDEFPSRLAPEIADRGGVDGRIFPRVQDAPSPGSCRPCSRRSGR
jgi:hypothetical protein